MERHEIRIGSMLVEAGVITSSQLALALEEQKKNKSLLCSLLIKRGYATESQVFPLLSQQIEIPYVCLRDKRIEPEVISVVPVRLASYYRIIPLELRDSLLTVAMVDPQNVRILDDLKLLLGFEVKGALAGERDIEEAMSAYYGLGAAALDAAVADRKAVSVEHIEQEQAVPLSAEEASIAAFVNKIFSEAIRQRATDIHLEPYHNELRIRFRIDGILYEVNLPQSIPLVYPRIVSRIKIMARLNIVERRLPQDGRIRIQVDGRELDLRISTIPMSFGEGVHIRVLDNSSGLSLENLGFLSDNLSLIEKVIRKPHGILFVSGPTGSGKSTTLYAALSRLNASTHKIITIEDPIEYQMRGINQIQVNPQIGLSFLAALRNVLRHDPDIIMVGEVRDRETADIAIRSALTGHLVFSTLHTNDAAGTVTRLLDMGIEPFLLTSSLECLIAQRLVRLICDDCKKRIEYKQETRSAYRIDDACFHGHDVYAGEGCPSCRFTGYRGRTGIYEIIPVTGPIREMILDRASSQQIKHKARALGMRTLREDGFEKVKRGLTTISEIMRVTQQEE